MKTRLRPLVHSRRLVLLAGTAILLAGEASARDYIRIPLPPPPREILHDVGDLLHRIGDRVGTVVRRFPWVDDDEERERGRAPRRSKAPPPVRRESWDDARKQVPYRYDDAEDFDARMQPAPVEQRPAELPDSALTERRAADSPRGDVPPVNIVGPKTPAGDTPVTKVPEAPAPSAPAEVKRPEAPPPVPKAAEPGNLLPGTPVSGKRGLVYPPGAKHTPENMVDVTDFKSGQVVRDPRTGSLFRVP